MIEPPNPLIADEPSNLFSIDNLSNNPVEELLLNRFLITFKAT